MNDPPDDTRRQALRDLPAVDALAATPALDRLDASHPLRVEAARAAIDAARASLLAGDAPQTSEAIAATAAAHLEAALAPSLRPVINATGVIIHTNLGRAPLSADAIAAGLGTCNLEYDLDAGRRGSRGSHTRRLLCTLSGAEAALVVNNNAAAVVLMLSGLATGREVLISRGELVEIGGSFRVPEIMETSGAILREVGTTNRTYARDYASAAGDDSAAILRVHPSNYRVSGFVHRPTVPELSEAARAHGLHLFYDLGTGTFAPLPGGLSPQGDVRGAIAGGADVVCFSGDKLLGGPQAGILVGRAALIERLATHPLARAMRPDKLVIAALEATLLAYRSGATDTIPVARMLHTPTTALRRRAHVIVEALSDFAADVTVVATRDPIGGGSHPDETLPGAGVSIRPRRGDAGHLAERLRHAALPIVGVVSDGALRLHLRTIPPDGDDTVVAALKGALQADGDGA